MQTAADHLEGANHEASPHHAAFPLQKQHKQIITLISYTKFRCQLVEENGDCLVKLRDGGKERPYKIDRGDIRNF